ncbi:sensor histidine kinase [Pseudorhodoferax sp.]|uniref:sensor histidine kinase n=1 Tax=Pseudorhodoferax sp. TaxID=1993553 RepID=UPI0039E5828A
MPTLLRHYLHVLALCCIVAVLTTLIWPTRVYLVQLVYSLCIGSLCWGVIETGRALVPARHCHPSADGGKGWPRGWRGALVVACGIAVGFLAGDWLALQLVGPGDGQHAPAPNKSYVGLYITILAGAAGAFYFHARGKAAAMAARIAAAERDASEARLKLLEAQLEPHMLFNTLANLRVLIALDPPRATRMLDHLVAFLRATLQASRSTEHTLEQEFSRLRDYLELMAVRMGPRLRFVLELPPPSAQRPVPALLLQPLVENAVRHGLEPQVAGGTVSVRAWEDGDRLWLEVTDDGAGPAPDGAPQGTGFGLSQIRARLATRYGDLAGLRTQAGPQGGMQALLWLPLLPAAPG